MRVSILATSGLLIVGFALGTIRAGDEKKTIKPIHHWGGIIQDKEKQIVVPKAGYITTEKSFTQLWSEWSLPATKMPKLDFKAQIVFVQLASGPNAISTTYRLDKDGDLMPQSEQTLKAGPGFGYGIDVLERKGIKSYKGKPLE